MKVLSIALALGLAACDRGSTPLVAEAELGIFYGGQVQERDAIPFELDRGRQIQGFRLTFSKPLERDVHVRWEVDKPDPARQAREARVVRLAEATAAAGQRRFEQVLPFLPGEPLGIYNVRVFVERQLVIDRAIHVTEPKRR
jgi:hypothetical protein